MWPWIEGKGGELIIASEVEAIYVKTNQVYVKTRGGSIYAVASCESKEEAQQAQKELAELIARIIGGEK